MTPTVKLIIGVVLLVIGLYVVWAGYSEGETLTMILGGSSVLGGIAFLATSRRSTPRPLV